MSYKPGTILERKDPFEAPEEGSEEPDLTPYNEIKVVGPSPVVAQGAPGEWGGVTAAAISIQPTSFGAVIDKPLGELQRDYQIVQEPEPVPLERGEVTVIEYEESPEEVFAREAAERGEEPPPAARPAKPGDKSPEEVFASQQEEHSHKLSPAEIERHDLKD